MRTILLATTLFAGLPLLSACVAPKDTRAPPVSSSTAESCVRHSPVTALNLAAELTSVYADCQPHFACPPGYALTGFETKSIDGYNDYSQWLWSGVSSTTFDIPTQDNLMQAGINAANSPTYKPAGKSVTNIVFFRDILVDTGPVYYFLGEVVTYAKCYKAVWRLPYYRVPPKS